MDDLKTFAKSDSQQTSLLNIIKTFSNDIKMEFGLDKCAKATFKRGKLTETSDLQLDIDTCIKELDQEDTYKYLGVDEGDGIQHAKMKERVRKEYYHRVRMVLKTELNAANRVWLVSALTSSRVLTSKRIMGFQATDWHADRQHFHVLFMKN